MWLCFFVSWIPLIKRMACHSDDAECVVMVDAGSNGSKVYVFTDVTGDEFGRRVKLPKRAHVARDLVGNVGLAETVKNNTLFTGVTQALARNIALAREQHCTPEHVLKVYVFGTAGFRLEADTPAWDTFFQKVEASIRETLMSTHSVRVDAFEGRVITGSEEAYWAWLSANYDYGAGALDATLQVKAETHNLTTVLEIGGTSLQTAQANATTKHVTGISYLKYGRRYFRLGMRSADKCDNRSGSNSKRAAECKKAVKTALNEAAFDPLDQLEVGDTDKIFVIGGIAKAVKDAVKVHKHIAAGSGLRAFHPAAKGVTFSDLDLLRRALCERRKTEILEAGVKEKNADARCFDITYLLEMVERLVTFRETKNSTRFWTSKTLGWTHGFYLLHRAKQPPHFSLHPPVQRERRLQGENDGREN